MVIIIIITIIIIIINIIIIDIINTVTWPDFLYTHDHKPGQWHQTDRMRQKCAGNGKVWPIIIITYFKIAC